MTSSNLRKTVATSRELVSINMAFNVEKWKRYMPKFLGVSKRVCVSSKV
jgi:hypothetical protein